MVMTSGSTYVAGGAFGLKSRGGVVTVLRGSAGFAAGGAWALATMGASAVVPAIVPIALMNFRREAMPSLPLPRSSAITVLLERRDLPARAGVQRRNRIRGVSSRQASEHPRGSSEYSVARNLLAIRSPRAQLLCRDLEAGVGVGHIR